MPVIGTHIGVGRRRRRGGGEAPVPVVKRYIAPASRGAADGSSLANAVSPYGIGTLVAELTALGVAGSKIVLLCDEGDYNQGGGSPYGISTGPASSDLRITISPETAAGVPGQAVFKGSRPPGTTGATGGAYTKGFQLNTGANNLTFQRIRFDNYGNGCFFQNGHVDGLILEDIDAYNVYRVFENGQATEYGATLTNFIFRRWHVEGFERQMWRLRGGSHHGLCQLAFGDALNYDGDAFCTGTVIQTSTASSGDACHHIRYEDVFVQNVKQFASGSSYKNGDLVVDADSSAIAQPYALEFIRCTGVHGTDSGIDEKGIGTYVYRAKLSEAKRIIKCWAKTVGTPSIYEECITRAPWMQDGDEGGYMHVNIADTNGHLQLKGHRFHNRAAETAGTKLIQGKESTNSQILEFLDAADGTPCWARWNIEPGTTIFERESSPSNPYGITISYQTALPTITGTVTWRAGFEYGMIPKTTPVGTVVADCAVTSGVGVPRLVGNPGGYFSINSSGQIVLASELSYAAAPYFNINVRFVYAIVGASDNYWGTVDPNNDLTWQCYGVAYQNVTAAVLVAGDGTETEFDAYRTDGLAAGCPALTSYWATLYNYTIRRYKDAGLWAKRASIHLLAGQSQEWALRDLKNTYHASIVGTLPAQVPKVGFTGSGNSANYLSLSTMDPTTIGAAWTQDNCGYTVRIETDSVQASAIMTYGTNTLLSARNTTSAGAVRVNAGGTGSIAGVATSIGIWQAMRASSSQYNIMQDGTVKSTINTASQALNSADRPRLFTGTNAHTASWWLYGDLSVVAEKTAERSIINDVRAIYSQFP